jgi:hypothetical protein
MNRKDRGAHAYISTRRKRKLKVRSKEERNRLRTAAMRRHRNHRDACLIPDRFLRRLHVGPEGAMAVAFSNSGHLLASKSFPVKLTKLFLKCISLFLSSYLL